MQGDEQPADIAAVLDERFDLVLGHAGELAQTDDLVSGPCAKPGLHRQDTSAAEARRAASSALRRLLDRHVSRIGLAFLKLLGLLADDDRAL